LQTKNIRIFLRQPFRETFGDRILAIMAVVLLIRRAICPICCGKGFLEVVCIMPLSKMGVAGYQKTGVRQVGIEMGEMLKLCVNADIYNVQQLVFRRSKLFTLLCE
jgi:hypothetical protein